MIPIQRNLRCLLRSKQTQVWLNMCWTITSLSKFYLLIESSTYGLFARCSLEVSPRRIDWWYLCRHAHQGSGTSSRGQGSVWKGGRTECVTSWSNERRWDWELECVRILIDYCREDDCNKLEHILSKSLYSWEENFRPVIKLIGKLSNQESFLTCADRFTNPQLTVTPLHQIAHRKSSHDHRLKSIALSQ